MPRKTALDALERCRRDGAWSGQVLSSLLEKRAFPARDAALASRLFFGTLQNLSYLDHSIASYTKGKLEPKVRDILRLGAYQLFFMDRIPGSAAVNESVKLCKAGSFARAAGLVNAVLRRMAKEGPAEIPGKGNAAYLSTLYSHPLWIVEELISLRGYDGAEAVLKANNQAVPIYIQTNTNRVSPQALAATMEAKAHESLAGCLILSEGGSIANMPQFQQGLFYVQDPAARMAVAMAEPKPGMRVLDACAAPGGKSFTAALEMNGEGEILSCDVSAAKLSLVADGAQRMGMDCIRCKSQDARTLYEGEFDLIIADVPCSGMGVIRKKPDIRYRDPKDIAQIPWLQLEILKNLSRGVKPGAASPQTVCQKLCVVWGIIHIFYQRIFKRNASSGPGKIAVTGLINRVHPSVSVSRHELGPGLIVRCMERNR